MSKYVETSYSNKKEILKFPDHYVALAVTVDDTGVMANAEGKKIVPAGTILGGGVLADPSKVAKKAKTTADKSDAEGVLLNDTDVTYGPASGAMVIHGFIDVSKIPNQPDVAETAALKQITFLK
ncbi:hypothetical protein [Brevibacillus laterosporus]|uniref:hypothetical protein n=1 Tax=Brevibacillus laterosporus TaxID=1465 RepID=UPI0003B18A5E|nr:hypothetical protein [Brevibacillus laterosporus]ERM20335.1 hypothetical protein P615_00050 [Brevibacillus laterosporus PE36]